MATITVACLQLEAHELSQAEEALARALAMIDRAGERDPDLMILPECTYPAYYLHSLEHYRRADLRPHDEVVRLFGERARRHGCHLVVGIAEPAPSGRLLNAAYLYDPDGAVVGTYAKSFLWHFDQYWFDPGVDFPTFELPFGRTGMLVCADGRMPEIARSLGLGRSQLIVDPTAWVSTGGDRQTLSNPQFEYMVPVRAMENGTWIAVANKVGIEAETVVYCGRSCIIAPDGRHVAQASTDREELLMAEIDLDEATGPPLPRRPECYGILNEPTDTLPITKLLDEPLVPADTVVRIGAVQVKPFASAEAWLARVTELTETLVRQEAELVVLPGIPAEDATSPAYRAEGTLASLRELSRRLDCGLVAPLIAVEDGRQYKAVYLFVRGEVLGVYRKVHLADEEREHFAAGDDLPVFETPYGRIGIMLEQEGLLTEVPRSLMLAGADQIVWPAHASSYPLRTVARSRADENKVFVALATPLEAGVPPQTALIDPGGSVVAAALPDVEQGIAGQMAWAFTRYKEMAPNTNVVMNRQPAAYMLSGNRRRPR